MMGGMRVVLLPNPRRHPYLPRVGHSYGRLLVWWGRHCYAFVPRR